MQWYYVENGAQTGPIDDEAFNALIAQGRVQLSTLVWREGMADWKPWGEVSGAAAPPLPPFQPFPEQTAAPEGLIAVEYAGFWYRVLATIIDNFVEGFAIMIPAVVIFLHYVDINALMQIDFTQPGAEQLASQQMLAPIMIVGLISIFFQAAYKTLMIGKYGATLGYMACRLRLVRGDMTQVTYGRAFGRFGAELIFQILGQLPLLGIITLINYLMVAFDREKRAFHDMMCDTRVIKIP